MDFLQLALIFLILLLSIFLGITGIQVFFILKDLKKALDKFNVILDTGENIAEDIERPVAAASNLATSAGAAAVSGAAKILANLVNKKPKPKRFYKRSL